ncbi:MAG: 16S rRNA (cytosine(1402)-N(4))-methyltransferase RsmH [Deltaproteobacteria bacterium]|nr:16S rRNA (cytosine(1402)-N(4))-methyltransferase RsmH [Deltaproteobacteria bacterium]
MHKAVLLNEVIEFLKPQSGGVYFDGTFGGGEHTQSILNKTHHQCRVIAVDQDLEAIQRASVVSQDKTRDLRKNLHLIHDNFKNIKLILKSLEIEKIDGILLDVGVSSFQLEDGKRGFSFLEEGPLDMRMNTHNKTTAGDILNKNSEQELARIFYEYGEEKESRRIAKKIIEERPIHTTLELVSIIKKIKGPGKPGKHPATQIFQALRIAVNEELESLKEVLHNGLDVLKEGGRFCVISFHSLEDRLVKQTFAYAEKECVCPDDFPVCRCHKKCTVKVLTKRPITPSREELFHNPRARSAKLRVAERVCL